MANDIIIIDPAKDINDNNIVCSTQTNGSSSTKKIYDGYPANLTIDTIQDKYTDRFDEIRYYTVKDSSAPPEPSATPTPTPTSTPPAYQQPETQTPTPTPTETPTTTPTPTSTTNNIASSTPTPTPTKTTTPTPTKTPTLTPTSTISATPTPSPASGVVPTPTVTPTATVTPTTTVTPTPTASSSASYPMTNTANYISCADWNSLNGNVTTIGTNGISSPYATYDMNGNVWEWNEAIIGSTYRGYRGGGFNTSATYLPVTARGQLQPGLTVSNVGFRIATISNPNSFGGFVDIGDSNNSQHPNGYGSVSYAYKIQKFLVTNTEYVEFLNAVAVTDSNNLYPAAMVTDARSGITRSGSDGSYSYSVKTNMGNKPANLMSWYNAARFANWLHNNKPSGLQNNSTTESGAYELTGNTGLPTRNFGAKYFLPSENEWVKTAYYKSGSVDAGYWNYATSSDTVPTCVAATSTGDGITS